MAHFPPSPPSSTSLPSHFSYPPLFGSDPPPTDGPNTREKIRMGLLPRSGRIGPVLTSSSRERREEGEVEGYDWSGGGKEGDRSWDSTRTVGEENYLSQSQTSSSAPHHSSNRTETPYAASSSIPLEAFIDPILRSSTTSTSSLYSSTQHGNDSEGDFSFYPPPLPSVHEVQEPTSFKPEGQRIVSNATIIDHGRPYHEEYDEEEVEKGELVIVREKKSSSTTTKVANGLGMTKEEWLRLGGFTEDPLEEEPSPSKEGYQDVFALPSVVGKPSTTASSTLNFNLPPPVFPPTPIEPSPDSSTFSYFAPPQPPLSSVWEKPSALTAAELSRPTPPTHFQIPLPLSSPTKSSPTKKQRSTAPSPSKQTRSRPSPYPTTSTISSQPLPQSSSQSLILPPLSPSTLRNLTPVSTALLQYSHYPVPTHPPIPSEFPKKSHGRRTSPGHIPRPRNAFILFRSHAVSTGLIPKSAGVKDAKNVSQIIGRVWKGLSEGDRGEWEELAKVEKMDHARKWPGYRYTPRQRKVKGESMRGKGKKTKEDQDDGEWEEVGDSPEKKQSKKRTSTKGEKKKMELIGDGLLVNEYGQAQLPTLPPFTTPTKQPRYPTGDIIVSPSSNTPQSVSSTSTILNRSSPHSQNTTPTKFRPLPSSTSSPASSNSPSPQRMPLPLSRPSPNTSPSKKHPLSNSHGPSSSASSPSKKTHYSRAGLGIQHPPSSSSISMDQIPLFTGPTESRQFSLGRFALTDPFSSTSQTQQQQQIRKPSSSYRELVAQQEEEEKESYPHSRTYERDFTSLDPREFLDSSSLTYSLPLPPPPHSQEQEEETYSTWDDSSSLSSYSTAPTTISSNWNRPLDFGRTQSQAGGGHQGGQGQAVGGNFHFGSMDLFSKPINPLFNSSSSRSTSSSITQPQAQGTRNGNGMVGLGIRWEEERGDAGGGEGKR